MYALQSPIKYYATGHTGKGMINFLRTNLYGIDRVLILEHRSIAVKTVILEMLIDQNQRKKLEIISSPSGKEYIEGVIIREQSLAIINDTIVDEEIPGAIQLNLAEYIHSDILIEDKMTPEELVSKYNEAYAYFAKGLDFHEQLEGVYIGEMDFDMADNLTEKFIHRLFRDVLKNDREAIVMERLFGTNTPDGIVNHLKELIDGVSNRLFIKGRAGTGKSVFIKRIAAKCREYGIDIELYHCSFDPNSIDMLIIRDLDWCLFDSTAPHELFPTRASDEILDLYETTVTPGTDEKYAPEITLLMEKYKHEMAQGLSVLKKLKRMATEEIDYAKKLLSDINMEQLFFKIYN